MLDGLHKIEWEKFEHAYGTAEDVPDLIESLTSSDAEVRNRAHEKLYNNICHQGTVYEAATYAVPFLIELVNNEAVEDRSELLVFLRHLAADDYNYEPPDVKPMSDEEWLEQMMDEQQGNVTPPYKAVRLGIEVYLPLLNDNDPHIRIGAAYLLARFADKDARIPEALWARLQHEDEDTVEVGASLILALRETSKKDDDYRQVCEELLQETEDPICRFAAAISLALNWRENAPASVLDVLTDAVQSPDLYKEYEDMPWSYDKIIIEACDCIEYLGSAALPAIPQILHRLRTENFPIVALSMSSLLLSLLFNSEETVDSFDKLSEDQQQTLIAMVENNRTWRFGMNAAELLNRYGLPETRDDLRKFAGLPDKK